MELSWTSSFPNNMVFLFQHAGYLDLHLYCIYHILEHPLQCLKGSSEPTPLCLILIVYLNVFHLKYCGNLRSAARFKFIGKCLRSLPRINRPRWMCSRFRQIALWIFIKCSSSSWVTVNKTCSRANVGPNVLTRGAALDPPLKPWPQLENLLILLNIIDANMT